MQVLLHFGPGGAFRPLPSQGSAALGGVAVGVWRMVKAWPCSRSACRLSLRRWLLAPNIGRGVTPLPSFLRRSFSVEMVARWWWLLCSGALLLRLSCWGLWLSVLLCWGWLYTVVYLSVFNRARNKRARTREGLPLLFPASLPSAGLLVAFFFGGRCRGIPSTPGKRGGAFLSVFYISGGKVKNPHGHKISTAGAVLVPSWRCWFWLLRLSVLGQAVTISAGMGLPWKSPAHA